MISVENLQTEPNPIEGVQYEGDFTEKIGQQERGQFMSFIGRAAARITIVGAVAGSVLVGQSHEEAEAAPVPQAPVSCTKNGQEGIRLGSLCVTRQEVRASGDCDVKQIGGLLGIAGLVVPSGAVAAGLGVTGTGLTYYEDRLKAAIC